MVLIGDRDATALKGVAGTERDTVLVWGVLHLAGIGAGLREQGFRRLDDTEWHTAATQMSIRAALRQLIRRRTPVPI